MIDNKYSLLQYAYVGDAIYELLVREYLLSLGNFKVNELKNRSLSFVSASKQAYFVSSLSNYFFTSSELDIIRRGRNVKVNSKPKSCSIITYHLATSLEVLFGVLYLEKNYVRMQEIFSEIIKKSEEL